MSRACTKCKVDTPLSGFYNDCRRSDGKGSACIPCVKKGSDPAKVRARNASAYRRRANDGTLISKWTQSKYEGIACMDCGGVFDWCAMDFDHRQPENKSFCVSRIGRRVTSAKNIALVSEEIAKCDLVCSNCHRVRTKERHNAG